MQAIEVDKNIATLLTNLEQRVGKLKEPSGDSMAGFVVGDPLPLQGLQNPGPLLQSSHNLSRDDNDLQNSKSELTRSMEALKWGRVIEVAPSRAAISAASLQTLAISAL